MGGAKHTYLIYTKIQEKEPKVIMVEGTDFEWDFGNALMIYDGGKVVALFRSEFINGITETSEAMVLEGLEQRDETDNG